MKTYEYLITQTTGAVLHIRLNRTERHNALNQKMIAELTQAFAQAPATNGIRVVVLSGEGKSFCAGADLDYMRAIADFGPEENTTDAVSLATLFDTIYHCPIPVVGIVHGAVVGGANGLMAACDIVIAEKDCMFAFSEVKLGITPATISPYVIRRCGQAAARELMLTGRRFDAADAFRLQLVNAVVDKAQLEEKTQYYVSQLLEGAPGALSDCKQLIDDMAGSHLSTTELIPETAKRIAARRASAEAQEGISAFFEKRKPRWRIIQQDEDQ